MRRERTCPGCTQRFYYAKTVNGKKTCPHCGLEIFYGTNGKVLPLAEKETATVLVGMLCEHVARRDKVEFPIQGSALNKERVHAYAIITQTNQYLNSQKETYGLDPYQLATEVLAALLADRWYGDKIMSLLMVRNQITKQAHLIFRDRARNAKINSAHQETTIDFSLYAVV